MPSTESNRHASRATSIHYAINVPAKVNVRIGDDGNSTSHQVLIEVFKQVSIRGLLSNKRNNKLLVLSTALQGGGNIGGQIIQRETRSVIRVGREKSAVRRGIW